MKVILIIKNQEPIIYPNLTSIQKQYPQYTYHQLRQIYLQSTNIYPRKMHKRNQKLYDEIKILDYEIEPIDYCSGA